MLRQSNPRRTSGYCSSISSGIESLTIEADADVLPKLTSNVSRGILELGVTPGTTIATSRRIVYRLTVATLGSLAMASTLGRTTRLRRPQRQTD